MGLLTQMMDDHRLLLIPHIAKLHLILCTMAEKAPVQHFLHTVLKSNLLMMSKPHSSYLHILVKSFLLVCFNLYNEGVRTAQMCDL